MLNPGVAHNMSGLFEETNIGGGIAGYDAAGNALGEGGHPLEPQSVEPSGFSAFMDRFQSQAPALGLGIYQIGKSFNQPRRSSLSDILGSYYLPTFPTSVYSDARMKQDVQPVRQMMDQLAPYTFRYRSESGAGNPFEPQKRYLGVMAQDLEKSPLGQTMVENTPMGKTIDVGKGVGAFLAATADLNRRLNALERRKKNA